MTGLPENIEELLTELVEKSRHEMNIMLALADAIRRTDEQLLREVRSVTASHELRRAEIKSELQALSSRLCAIPVRPLSGRVAAEIDRPRSTLTGAVPPEPRESARAIWNQDADDIDVELNETFGEGLPRH